MSMFRTYSDLERPPTKSNSSSISPTSYKCVMCNEGDWMSETEVEIHKQKNHQRYLYNVLNSKNHYACSVCAKQHKDSNLLYKHFKTAHLFSSEKAERIEREIFICDHCHRIFFNKMLLIIHIHRKHQSNILGKGKIQCPKCLKHCAKSTIWSHLENHHISSVSTCPICLEKCANRQQLQKHVEKHRKYYFCNLCNFSMKCEDNFMKHMNSHRKENHRLTDKYHRYFIRRFKKLRHFCVPNVLKGLPLPHDICVCVICRYICVNMEQMKRHVVFDHTPESVEKKVYFCVCGQEFQNNVFLKQHILKERGYHKAVENGVQAVIVVSDTDVLDTAEQATIVTLKLEHP